jgi:hypothetical protein
MITFTSDGLRQLADALDGLAKIESETGVLIEGYGENTLTLGGVTLRFIRRTTGGPEAELVDYTVEIREG